MSLSHPYLNPNTIDDINVNDLDDSHLFGIHLNTIKILKKYVIQQLKQIITDLKTDLLHHNKTFHCYQKNHHFLYQKNIISSFKPFLLQ